MTFFKRAIDLAQLDLKGAALRRLAAALALLVIACTFVTAQSEFESRPIREVAVVFDGADRNAVANEQFRSIARDALGTTYSAVRIRDAIEKLYSTRRIDSITVEAAASGENAVDLRFLIKRKTQAQRVNVEIVGDADVGVTEQELLFRLNILEPGTPITEQTLRNNASIILEYLRDRGFFRSEVTHTQRPLDFPNEVGVTFRVSPGEQARVGVFDIRIAGYDNAKLLGEVKLQPGERYSLERLNADVQRVRETLRDDNYLAPQINDARPVYDHERNVINIELTGSKGPTVEVEIDAERDRVGGRTQRRILPVISEGTLDTFLWT
jgi:outer membrane protein assembly factor BamA